MEEYFSSEEEFLTHFDITSEEFSNYYSMDFDEYILHYGMPRRSGRYPWGSGENPQRSKDILNRVDELKAKGFNEKQRADELGMSVKKLRSEVSIANKERQQYIYESVQSGLERGDSNTKIAERLGISEGSVRKYRDMSLTEVNRLKQIDATANNLKSMVERSTYLDVGPGTEQSFGVSREKLRASMEQLRNEGYHVHNVYVEQMGARGKWTTLQVLTKEPDQKVVSRNKDQIRPPDLWYDDPTLSGQGLRAPKPFPSDKVKIVYTDDGGHERDGLIEMRRGVKDLDMGGAQYAQVRIQVDKTHYMKGMAVYSDNLPDGVDVLYHTNKSKDTPKMEVFKKLKDNPDNPFGATIKLGGQKGAINLVNEEGDWNEWSSKFASQFLAKQPLPLVKDRLETTYGRLSKEFEEINSLTNPIVKRHLMESFADDLERKAASLKVDPLPRTRPHVILPYPNMKENEIYAPNYKDGESVVLVRYPHGGRFELPQLIVNNKGPAKNHLQNAVDAVGIHPKVAQKLSGADFDGDTVFIIPNNHDRIKTEPALAALKNFDPKEYKVDPDVRKTITHGYMQKKMGETSNLITDMTIKGANTSEIARAVKHSMVVIDSEKHNLDWKKSERDNGIVALQKKYQSHIGKYDGKHHTAASTLLSLANQDKRVPDPTRKGKTMIVPHMSLVDDANIFNSGTKVESLYASYSNNLKALRNKALKIVESIKPIQRDPRAAKIYSEEVKSLVERLTLASSNAPKERQAQLLANKLYSTKLKQNPELFDDKEGKKRLRGQLLATSRLKVGAKNYVIKFSDREWEAVQNGAISNDRLLKLLRYADMDQVKSLATPRPTTRMSSQRRVLARTLLSNGYTYAQVAERMGVNVKTLRSNL